MVERGAQDGVARLQGREIDRHVGLGARVRLHVRVLRAEEPLQTFDREGFGDVDVFAAAVVPFARVAFGVLVGQHRAGRFAHRRADVVFGGDELEVLPLALLL